MNQNNVQRETEINGEMENECIFSNAFSGNRVSKLIAKVFENIFKKQINDMFWNWY